MTPTGTPNYGANDMRRNAVLFAKHFLSYPTRDIFAPDSHNIAVSKRRFVAAFPIDIPVFSSHIADIIKWRPKKQMVGIYAGGIVALMTDKVRARLNAVMNTIRKAMSCGTFAPVRNKAVSSALEIPAPHPALFGIAGGDVFPKRFLNGSPSAVMPVDVTDVFALCPPLLFDGARGNGGDLTTPTHAQSGWIGRFKDYSFLSVAGAMVLAITKRLALNHVAILARYGGNVCLLAAATMTKAIWNFIGIGGILGHTDISLVDIGHVPGRSNVAGTLSYPHYCSTTEQMCKDGRYL